MFTFICYCALYYHIFFILQKMLANMKKCYDFTSIDSVSITLVFLTIITLSCMVYNLFTFFKEKCTTDGGTATE